MNGSNFQDNLNPEEVSSQQSLKKKLIIDENNNINRRRDIIRKSVLITILFLLLTIPYSYNLMASKIVNMHPKLGGFVYVIVVMIFFLITMFILFY